MRIDRLGRVDVGVAHHELLQNVVLNGSGQLGLRHPLLLSGHDITGKHRQDRTVHGHGHTHFVERDAVEQDLHVVHAVDGDARLANIAGHARVVAVVAAMGRQIEGNGQPLLTASEALR